MMGSEALASIVDEAGQVTEHHTLCAINPNTLWLILVGDHVQLPPCVVEEPGTEQGTDFVAFRRRRAGQITEEQAQDEEQALAEEEEGQEEEEERMAPCGALGQLTL
jgi:superfamily I DNA and/or RNA helicase